MVMEQFRALTCVTGLFLLSLGDPKQRFFVDLCCPWSKGDPCQPCLDVLPPVWRIFSSGGRLFGITPPSGSSPVGSRLLLRSNFYYCCGGEDVGNMP